MLTPRSPYPNRNPYLSDAWVYQNQYAVEELAYHRTEARMEECRVRVGMCACVTEEVRAYLLTGDGDGERGTPNRILSKNRRIRVHELYVCFHSDGDEEVR